MRSLSLVALVVASTACATLAGQGQGDVDLPNALTGPFRALKRGKVCDNDVCTGVDELPAGTSNGIIKYPGNPPSRSPSALVRGELHVVLYAGRGLEGQPLDRIVRMESLDGRTFEDVKDVLSADAPFEGGTIHDPAALDVQGTVWLYYNTSDGIARAVSTDGLTGAAFAKDGKPIALEGTKEPWETDPPRAPSVVRLDDGTFRMFYASGKAIGEAKSADGVTFTRVGLAIAPSNPVDPATLPEGVRPPFDDDSVDDPSIQRVVTAAGRVHYQLHYTGRDRSGRSSVGFAGRFGEDGKWEKREGFVFGGKLFGDPDGNSHANAPTVARFGGFALIFANVDYDKTQKLGIGIAPQRMTLPIAE
jgi:hypothetical protein